MMGDQTIRVRLQYDGGPACAARITDVATGAHIEGAFYVAFDANKSLPEAIIKVYQPVVDIETNAKVLNVCAACQRRIWQDSIWYKVVGFVVGIFKKRK